MGWCVVVLAALQQGAANAATLRPDDASIAAQAMPVPPIPPQNRPAYEAAPLPNNEAHGPEASTPQGIELVPRLYHRRELHTGLGYTPGSEFRERESDSLNRLGPGLNLRVPLK